MGIEKISKIEITDEDILWVEEILGGNIRFDAARVAVLKNMESIDIQAFPGSGKTTVLVAKLAILAKKWEYTNSGICVLSHTNVAREEIEKRLGNTEIGRKLLSYPHFIGTVHSFFDTYVALPWLKSNGYEINIIDKQIVRKLRWDSLPRGTRYHLEKNHKNESICEYVGEVGCIDWDKNGTTKEYLLSAIENNQRNGYFTFTEMLLYAKKALHEWSGITNSIQSRFPLLFIDEAQDTDDFQWNLLNMAFNNDSVKSIRQGFGDSNQAIYGNIYIDDLSGKFPRDGALVLNESRRFDSSIANLANTVALSGEKMQGTDNVFSKRDIKHTIFVFKKENASQVIDKFGEYVLEVFTDDELKMYEKEGIHIIGMIHDKKEETKPEHFPKGIYDYWCGYEAKKGNKRVMPQKLIGYFRRGVEEFQNTGEKSEQVEWIGKGLRRLVNIAKENNSIPATSNSISSLMKSLTEDQKSKFRKLLMKFTKFGTIISKEQWMEVEKNIDTFLELFDASLSNKVSKFMEWENEQIVQDESDGAENAKNLSNHYLYIDNSTGRTVDMEFGSIHSVKGRTHLATLVLETFLRTHNIKSLLKYLCGNPPKTSKHPEKKMKCQYVAMTRARALICVAIPDEFVNDEIKRKLEQVGWNIQII